MGGGVMPRTQHHAPSNTPTEMANVPKPIESLSHHRKACLLGHIRPPCSNVYPQVASVDHVLKLAAYVCHAVGSVCQVLGTLW